MAGLTIRNILKKRRLVNMRKFLFFLSLSILVSSCKSIHRSSLLGDLTSIKYLVENTSADVNKGNLNGKTSLILAAENGHLDVVNYLITQKASIFIMDNMGITPLGWSILNNHEDITHSLIQNIHNFFSENVSKKLNSQAQHSIAQAFYVAGVSGNKSLIINLLKNYKTVLQYKDKNGLTALFGPALVGNDTITQLFLESGANSEPAAEHSGYTPFHFAALAPIPGTNGYYYIVSNNFSIFDKQMLRKQLADSTSEGYIKTIDALLKSGVDVNSKTRRHETALHLAAIGAPIEVVKFLLENGGDVNARDIYGHTPSWFASQHHRSDIETLFESYGGTWK